LQTSNVTVWRYSRCPYMPLEGMFKLALDGAEWSNSRPAALTPGNNLGNHRTEG
jgi:hypothetical protein